MSIKQLPIANSPIVGLQYLAYPLNILLNYEECKPWFYNEYVQLTWNKDLTPFFTFCNKLFPHDPSVIPCLQYQIIDKSFLSKFYNNTDMHKLIINAIDDGWYIWSTFDEFYVPNRRCYQKTHFTHGFLLYGYNFEYKEYYIYGYTNNGVIQTSKINFEQFINAFLATLKRKGDGDKSVILLKRKDDFRYEFDMQFYSELLNEYLNSKNVYERTHKFNRPESEKIYGLEIYDYLIKYFDLLAVNEVNFDIRPLHILWEHKKCMNLRLQYFSENKYISTNSPIISIYKEIEKKYISITKSPNQIYSCK